MENIFIKYNRDKETKVTVYINSNDGISRVVNVLKGDDADTLLFCLHSELKPEDKEGVIVYSYTGLKHPIGIIHKEIHHDGLYKVVKEYKGCTVLTTLSMILNSNKKNTKCCNCKFWNPIKGNIMFGNCNKFEECNVRIQSGSCKLFKHKELKNNG